jgi:hypothetical protein
LSEERKAIIFSKFVGNESLRYSLLPLLGNIKTDVSNFKYILDLVEDGVIPKDDLIKLAKSNIIFTTPPEELKEVFKHFFSYGETGFLMVFECLHMFILFKRKELTEYIYFLQECIKNIGINDIVERNQNSGKMIQAVRVALKVSPDEGFAEYIITELLQSISPKNIYSMFDYISDIYDILIIRHFKITWQYLSQALIGEGEDYIKFFSLKNVLSSRISSIDSHVGSLFKIENKNTDSIFEWCGKNPDIAPMRLAELVPIFAGENNDYTQWHPVTKRLLDEFGSLESVLSALSINMGNYSWTGSLVPFFKAKMELFSQLLSHNNTKIKEWASENIEFLRIVIEEENKRDIEMDLL